MVTYTRTISSTTVRAWYVWNNYTTTAATTNVVWNTWTDATTTAMYYPQTTTATWNQWNRVEFVSQQAQYQDIRTPEQRAKDAAEYQARYDAQVAEAKIKAEAAQAAKKRAMELLVQELNQQQREDMEKRNFFIVQGGKSKKRYRINTTGYHGNIEVLAENDNAVEKYCVHGAYDAGCPEADHWLAQKLALQYDEDTIVRTANKTPLRIAA